MGHKNGMTAAAVALLLGLTGTAAAQPAFPALQPQDAVEIGATADDVTAPDGLAEPTIDDREFRCLALNVYWEAKSEPTLGKIAVAEVTLNRLNEPDFPDTICGVVGQGAHLGRHRCQFSWMCDGRSDEPRDDEAWAESIDAARTALDTSVPDPTQGALWFHATYVRPSWAKSKSKVAKIGRHIYYNRPL